MQFNMSPKNEGSLILVGCPINKGNYAGWYRQISALADRVGEDIEFCFVFKDSRTCGMWWNKALESIAYAVKYIAKALKSNRSIVGFFPSFFLPNVIASAFLKIFNKNYLVRISGGELNKNNVIAFFIRVVMLKKASGVICLNSSDGNKLIELGVSYEKVHVIYNPVAIKFRQPTSKERLDSRSNLLLDIDKTVIAVVGTVCARKGQLDLLLSLPRQHLDKLVIILCGPAFGHPEADKIYLDKCVEYAKNNNIELLHIEHEENVVNIYWASDIYCQPSFGEGMPNSLVEAMACALPCIGYDVPGIKDLITHKTNGYLVGVGDIDSFSVCLNDLIVNCNIRSSFGKRSVQFIAENNSTEVIDIKYKNLISACSN